MAHNSNKNQIENMITLQSMPSIVALELALKLIDYASNDMRIRLNSNLLDTAIELETDIETLLKEIENIAA